MENINKPKRKYPKKMSLEESKFKAIVILRDCAGLSFIAITRLIGLKDSSKRNVEYYYKQYKDKFRCAQLPSETNLKVVGGMMSNTNLKKQ